MHIDVVHIKKHSNTSQGIRGKEKSNNDNRFKGFIKSSTELTQATSDPIDSKTTSKVTVMLAP